MVLKFHPSDVTFAKGNLQNFYNFCILQPNNGSIAVIAV